MGEIFYFEPKIIRFKDSARKSEETPCLTIILQSPRDWTSQWFELVFYFNLVKVSWLMPLSIFPKTIGQNSKG